MFRDHNIICYVTYVSRFKLLHNEDYKLPIVIQCRKNGVRISNLYYLKYKNKDKYILKTLKCLRYFLLNTKIFDIKFRNRKCVIHIMNKQIEGR